jgi:hypothetical protein
LHFAKRKANDIFTVVIRRKHSGIRPQDIVILLKILILKSENWYIQDLVHSLKISLSEVSESLERSRFSGLLDQTKKRVNRQGLSDLLTYSIQYIFPVNPGPLVKGFPTAHSFAEFQEEFNSSVQFVWKDDAGTTIGQEIEPLYKNQIFAIKQDQVLHKTLALVDLLRVGKKRERNFASEKLISFIKEDKLL